MPVRQEADHFPFRSRLPDPAQRRMLAGIMAKPRDLVDLAGFPAVNRFTFAGMRRAFRASGLDAHDRLDPLARPGTGGWRGLVARTPARGGPLQ